MPEKTQTTYTVAELREVAASGEVPPEEVERALAFAADEIAALRASNEIMRQASEKYNSEIERLQKREAYLVAELNRLGGMDLNGDKDGLE